MRKGQISAEMLILLVVVLAIVALVAKTLMDMANTNTEQAKRANEWNMIKGRIGMDCLGPKTCGTNLTYYEATCPAGKCEFTEK